MASGFMMRDGPFPLVRGALLLGIAVLSTAGCLGDPTVRAVLVTESFAFDERAPDEATEQLGLQGCPGRYDPAAGRLSLARASDTYPAFVMILQRAEGSRGAGGAADPAAGRAWPLAAGAGGGFFGIAPLERWMAQSGSSGSWGHGSPFHTEESVTLRWDRAGATFDGEQLREGEVVRRVVEHEVTQFNATFSFTQTFEATYLGALPYDLVASCEPT